MAFAPPAFPPARAALHPSPRLTPKRPRFSTRPYVRAQTGYIPSDDDKAEPMSDIPTELTLTQQLLLKQYEEQVDRMQPDERRNLAIEIARQMMAKDNIIKKILKKDIDFGIQPPDPDDLQPPDKKF